MINSNIICIDFTKFKKFDDFLKFLDKNPYYRNVNIGESFEISYESSYNKLSKVWILDNFVIYIQLRESNRLVINPEFENMVLSKSIDVTSIKSDDIVKLDIDSILDRINKVGVDGLTLEEKEFLDKQN